MEFGISLMKISYKKSIYAVINLSLFFALSAAVLWEGVFVNPFFFKIKVQSYHDNLRDIRPDLYPETPDEYLETKLSNSEKISTFIGDYKFDFLCKVRPECNSITHHYKDFNSKLPLCSSLPVFESCNKQKYQYYKKSLSGENLTKYIKGHYLLNKNTYIFDDSKFRTFDGWSSPEFFQDYSELYNVEVPYWDTVAQLFERNVYLNAALYKRSYQQELETWEDYQLFLSKHQKERDIHFLRSVNNTVVAMDIGATYLDSRFHILSTFILSIILLLKLKTWPSEFLLNKIGLLIGRSYSRLSNLDKGLILIMIFYVIVTTSYFIVFECCVDDIQDVFDEYLDILAFPIISTILARFFYWIYKKISEQE